MTIVWRVFGEKREASQQRSPWVRRTGEMRGFGYGNRYIWNREVDSGPVYRLRWKRENSVRYLWISRSVHLFQSSHSLLSLSIPPRSLLSSSSSSSLLHLSVRIPSTFSCVVDSPYRPFSHPLPFPLSLPLFLFPILSSIQMSSRVCSLVSECTESSCCKSYEFRLILLAITGNPLLPSLSNCPHKPVLSTPNKSGNNTCHSYLLDPLNLPRDSILPFPIDCPFL